MRTAIVAFALLASATAGGQSSQTTCTKLGNQMNCQTTESKSADYSILSRGVQPVDASAAIIQGQQIRQQQLLMLQQSAARTAATDAQIRELQMLIAQEQKALERERREKDARFAKHMVQTEACIQLHDGDDKGIQDCVNTLKVTDPEYARAFAESQQDTRWVKELLENMVRKK